MSRGSITRSVVTACLAGMAWNIAMAETRYVSLDGKGISPFTSWYDAASNIPQVMAASANGDTIIVSNGVYRPTATITINKGVTITSLYGSAQTVINGSGGLFPGLTINNSATTTIYGLTINNFAMGGIVAVYVVGSKCVLDNCVISGNSSTNSGGGINGFFLNLRNCRIANNTSDAGSDNIPGGGGIFIPGNGNSSLENCIIVSNRVVGPGSGGGVFVRFQAVCQLKNCLFASNYSTNSGGGLGVSGAASVDNCQFIGNMARGNGGGVSGGIISNCLFSNNSAAYGNAGGDGEGGAVSGSALIENCTIVSNTCGYYGGGGVRMTTGRIRNCLISNNTSNWRGGGIYGAMLLENCTVASNTCGVWGFNGNGGGVNFSGAGTSVNSIVYFNNGGPSAISNYVTIAGTFWMNSCTAPDPGTAVSTNCITSDPQFANSTNGNFRPLKGSPCIDAGTNLGWMSTALDLDGHIRIREGLVDIGAYEWVPKCTLITTY